MKRGRHLINLIYDIGAIRKSGNYVTHKELDSERRLTRVETSERKFWWFFSTILAVLVAALIGIFALLFELQDQLSEVNSRIDNIEIRIGNVETYLKLNGNVPQQQ